MQNYNAQPAQRQETINLYLKSKSHFTKNVKFTLHSEPEALFKSGV